MVRALELEEAGTSLAPASDRLWSEDTRHPSFLVGLDLDAEELERRIRARLEDMVARGVVEEAREAWARSPSDTARRVLGLEEFATLPPPQALEATLAATRRLARYQRKWLRRLPVAARLDAGRPPGEIADEIVALAGARERLPRH